MSPMSAPKGVGQLVWQPAMQQQQTIQIRTLSLHVSETLSRWLRLADATHATRCDSCFSLAQLIRIVGLLPETAKISWQHVATTFGKLIVLLNMLGEIFTPMHGKKGVA